MHSSELARDGGPVFAFHLNRGRVPFETDDFPNKSQLTNANKLVHCRASHLFCHHHRPRHGLHNTYLAVWYFFVHYKSLWADETQEDVVCHHEPARIENGEVPVRVIISSFPGINSLS